MRSCQAFRLSHQRHTGHFLGAPPGWSETADPRTPASSILRCNSFVKSTFAALDSA